MNTYKHEDNPESFDDALSVDDEGVVMTDDELEIPDDGEPVFEYEFDYSKAEAWKYKRYLRGPVLRRSSLVVFGVLFVFSFALLIVSKVYLAPVVCLALIGLWVGMCYLADYLNISNYYKRTKKAWSKKARIAIYDDGVEITDLEDGAVLQHSYDDYYQMKAFEDRIYLFAGAKDILVIDRAAVPKNICGTIIKMYSEEA